ncbi:class I SAM-dependent methyltransferase [Sinosporangium siamense]|uniref:Methyltransferase type 11 domain-containing protein n=1 Tax=Sinosporangium siamense TaxID=1367973 RepID=A0A919RRZ6_9ACTN|nr:class I SAM-dependent methyltransferase [Sinosporangium siamense]GII97451.1 hypothetical protein Ssi02_76820 [Sinosporangium siamense]
MASAGSAATVAAHTGAHIAGVNISAAQLEVARTANFDPQVRDLLEFVEGDAMDLPFPDEHFDGAFSIEAPYRPARSTSNGA